MSPYSLPLCFCVFAFVSWGGCANFKERYEQNSRHAAALNHTGPIKPLFDSQGYYTGYAQRIKDDLYYHAPDGTIYHVSRGAAAPPKPPAVWTEHRDETGRLIQRTLAYPGEEPIGFEAFHYDSQGQLRGSTQHGLISGVDTYSYQGADGKVIPLSRSWELTPEQRETIARVKAAGGSQPDYKF